MAAAGDQGDVRLLADAEAEPPPSFVGYPGLFRAADAAAVSLQRQHFVAEGVQLALNPLAAGLTLLAAAGLLALENAVLTAVTTTLLVILLWVARAARWEKLWYECRGTAEEIKGLAWRYMMQLEPFPPELTAPEGAFVRALDEILRHRSEIQPALARQARAIATPVSLDMQRVRRLPAAERAALYVAARLRPERVWYAEKARRYAIADRTWFLVVFLVQLGAVGAAIWLAVRVASRPSASGLDSTVPVLTALGGATMGWARSKRYADLCSSYTSTAHTLSGLEATQPPPADDAALRAWANAVELALTREHDLWRNM